MGKLINLTGKKFSRLIVIKKIGNNKWGNCRWATVKQQNINKINSLLITYKNKKQSLSQWSEELCISKATLKSRLNKYGWSIEKAITTPVRKKKNHKRNNNFL